MLSDSAWGAPFVEVMKLDELFQFIEQVMKDAGATPNEHKTASPRRRHNKAAHSAEEKWAHL